jgi:hypothetical protein
MCHAALIEFSPKREFISANGRQPCGGYVKT